MNSRALIAGVVAAGCIAAAGAGGYLAVSTATQSSEAAPAQTVNQPAATTPVPTAPPASTIPAAEPAAEPARTVPAPRVQPPAPAPAAAKAPRHAGRRVAAPVEPAPEPAPRLVAAPAELPSDTVTSLPEVPEPAAATTPAAPVQATESRVAEWTEIELPSNAVIGIRLDTTVSSETARVEDPVQARVTRAVSVDGQTVIPAGARLDGVVTAVEQGGRIRDRARVGIRFTSIRIDDSTRVPLQTETIFRVGEAPGGEATAKIGASAVVGSILGGVFGGKKGAAIGGAAGAAGGTAMVVSGDRNAAILESGTPLTVRLAEPALFRLER